MPLFAAAAANSAGGGGLRRFDSTRSTLYTRIARKVERVPGAAVERPDAFDLPPPHPAQGRTRGR